MSRPKLLFFATEDWFVRSHFLPLVRRAIEDDYDVVVAARNSGALDGIDGVRMVATPFERGTITPWELGRQTAELTALLARERPDIVHAIALKPIVLLLNAGWQASSRILALTGRGYLAVGSAPWRRLVSAQTRRMIRNALRTPNTVLLVENPADAGWVQSDEAAASGRVLLMPGAGVDTTVFAPSPEPAGDDIVVGIVARLIRSKGIDLAVDAVRQLRDEKLPLTLRIGGASDLQNPDHFGEEEIARWRNTPGVELPGHIKDVAGFWSGAHIACLPSRGGEGMPRTLLEAAACGRPIVTTNTPGCADFVVDGMTGLVCAQESTIALADALRALASDAASRLQMGAAGRSRVCAGFTEKHAADCAAKAWRIAQDGFVKDRVGPPPR